MTTRAKKVLVCYSGSETARRALDAALDQMGYGSLLTVATVSRSGAPGANLTLSDARERILHRHLTAAYVSLEGSVADELVEAAASLDADLVVIGACSRNGGADYLGPVSAEVVRRAPCDVLVVR